MEDTKKAVELWGILRGWLSVCPPRFWGRPGSGAREASTRLFGGPHAIEYGTHVRGREAVNLPWPCICNKSNHLSRTKPT